MTFGLDQKAHRLTAKFRVKCQDNVWAAYGEVDLAPERFNRCPGNRH